MSKLQCSVCGDKDGWGKTMLQCTSCGTVLCGPCAHKFSTAIMFDSPSDVKCPKCKNEGFKIVS